VSTYAPHYKVPHYIAVATTEEGDESFTIEFPFENATRLIGNKRESYDLALEKVRDWADDRVQLGETVFIYTINTTVTRETGNVWDGRLTDGKSEPMRTDMN